MKVADLILAEARRWIGTPYVHQASCLGAGADCLGLVRGIWRAVYGAEPCAVPPYTADWAEAQRTEALLRACSQWLLPVEETVGKPAQVLVFRMRDNGIAKHLGIQTACAPVPQFIHAYSGHCVTESALSAPWARRLAARFAFPERVD